MKKNMQVAKKGVFALKGCKTDFAKKGKKTCFEKLKSMTYNAFFASFMGVFWLYASCGLFVTLFFVVVIFIEKSLFEKRGLINNIRNRNIQI